MNRPDVPVTVDVDSVAPPDVRTVYVAAGANVAGVVESAANLPEVQAATVGPGRARSSRKPSAGFVLVTSCPQKRSS